MLRQEELAFVKAMFNNELSPVFPRELRKAMAAGKKNKTTAANATSSLDLEYLSGVRSVALSSHDFPKLVSESKES